jgi:uncharacterized lipoprotein YehR (DUF1307 family)
MTAKKEQTKKGEDDMKMLKRRYANWKKQQSLNKRIDYEEYLVGEVDELDLDDQRQWQN